MAAGAQIGFHAAYNVASGQETGVGNALVGAYLNKIGLPYEAVIYITQAAPSSMTWLSVSEAAKRGIDVAMLAPPTPPDNRSARVPLRNTPSTAAISPPVEQSSALEQRSLKFVSSIFTNWSAPNLQALKALEGLYQDEVMYYGKVASQLAVLNDKRRFVERWPQRSYRLRPGTLAAQCNEVFQKCTVTGAMDWDAVNDAKRSSGVANFSYVVLMATSGVPKIAEENSKIVQGPIISTHVPGNPPWATNKTPCTMDGPKIENAEEAGVCHN